VGRRPRNNVLSHRVRGEAQQDFVVRWVRVWREQGSHVTGRTGWTMEVSMSFLLSMAAIQARLVGFRVPNLLEVEHI